MFMCGHSLVLCILAGDVLFSYALVGVRAFSCRSFPLETLLLVMLFIVWSSFVVCSLLVELVFSCLGWV